MQKIAEECGISKATLYKLFDSKEDLLIQVFEHLLVKMFKRATTFKLDQSLTSKQRLRKKILLELEANKEYRAFINLIFKAIPAYQNPNVTSVMKRTKAALMNWHRECLFEVYGERATWDLVILFQGTLREYIVLLADEQKEIQAERVADLVIYYLDQVIEKLEIQSPALSNEMMADYEDIDFSGAELSNIQQLELRLEQIQAKIKLSNTNTPEKNGVV